MDYIINIYKNNKTNTERYALGIKAANPLIAIGLNPSTADEKRSDTTIRKIIGIAERTGKDGFVMFNLYPQRTTKPSELNREFIQEKHSKNIEQISKVLESLNLKELDVLLGFGNSIESKDYLYQCFKDIVEVFSKYDVTWKHTGKLSKYGHPRHPLYVSYEEGLSDFDLDKYVNTYSS